jgi:hypothetical protein
LVGAAYIWLLLSLTGGGPLWDDVVGIASIIGLFAIIGYFGEGIATPMICLLRSRGHLNLRWFLLGGFVVGVWMWLFWSIYLGLFVYMPMKFNIMVGLLGCVAPALISTTVFWYIGWAADNKSLDRSGGKRLSHQA